jgi:hypothetical protein
MTKLLLKIILSATLFFFATFVSRAQSQDCLTKLDGAETLFNNGIFEEVPPLLEDCMDLYSENDKKKAYRLIILAYYMNDDIPAAEESMYLLLKEFPDYKPAANDLVDFQYIYNSFEVRKSLDVGITLGPAWTDGRIIQPFSLFSQKFSYRPDGPGFFAAAYLDIPVNEVFSINTEPGYLLARYKIHYENLIDGIVRIDQSETNSLIQLPVYGKVTFLQGQVQLYAKAGFMLGYMTSSKIQSNVERYNVQGVLDYSSETVRQDHLAFRNSLYYYLGGGAGMKLNFKKTYLFTEVDYHISLNKTLKAGTNRYDQPNLWTYAWIDSDFSLSHISVRVGIARSIYTIKKIR